jgi:hypothetical protein
MDTRAITKLFRLGLALTLLGGLAGGWQATQAAPMAQASAAPLGDHFGYTLDDTVTEAWLDATGGTRLTFASADDSFAGPIPIGFSFKYYENTYTQLYIATDGYITFGSGLSNFRNARIPWDALPNNLVAPFWDDLIIPDAPSGVFYKLVGSSPQRKFIVEWYQVDDPTYPYTFEVVLYENGNILFQYDQLVGDVTSASAGIEDAEGMDGLQYVYNQAGLAVGKDILFTRPPAGPHVKILPPYRSGFATGNYASFQVVVRNAGDNQADTFNLRTSSSNPLWSASLLNAAGQPLGDSDSDGLVDTGSVPVGGSFPVTVRLDANPSAVVGDYTTVEMTATSKLQNGVFANAQLHSAIPAPYSQVYVTGDGVHIQQIWEQNIVDNWLDSYTGASLAIRGVTDYDYIVAWEKFSTSGGTYKTEIEYKIINRLTGPGSLKTLTDSQGFLGAPVTTSDARLAAIALAQNGQTGAAWRQFLRTSDNRYKSNIYLAVMNSAGTLLSSRTNLTNDDTFYTYAGDYHDYTAQTIAGLGAGFYVCWLDKFVQSAVSGRDLYCGIYSLKAGQIQTDVQRFKVDGSTSYVVDEPSIVALTSGDVLVAYTRSTGSGFPDIVYAVHNNGGQPVKPPTVITGAKGDRVRTLHFSNGNTLVAWIDASSLVGYALLDSSNNLLPGFPKVLPGAMNRSASYISMARESSGNAVVTWIDPEESSYLFYALLNEAGAVVTPPMLFHYPVLLTSSYGFGNAAYIGIYSSFMPMISK